MKIFKKEFVGILLKKEKHLYICNNTQKSCIFADVLQKANCNGRI